MVKNKDLNQQGVQGMTLWTRGGRCNCEAAQKVITGFFYFLAVKALYWGPRPNFGAIPVR